MKDAVENDLANSIADDYRKTFFSASVPTAKECFSKMPVPEYR